MDLLSPQERRKEIARQLAMNAATKPSNVATGAGVATAGLVLYGLSGASLMLGLIPLALFIYTALIAMSFFDEKEGQALAESRKQTSDSKRSSEQTQLRAELDPQVLRLLENALHQEMLVRQAIAESDSSMSSLGAEVAEVVEALHGIAKRANKLRKYIASQDRALIATRLRTLQNADGLDSNRQALKEALSDQIKTLDKMGAQVISLEEEMEHVGAMLATMHGQLVQMSVDEESLGEVRLTEMAKSMRMQVSDAADTMQEVAALS